MGAPLLGLPKCIYYVKPSYEVSVYVLELHELKNSNLAESSLIRQYSEAANGDFFNIISDWC